LGNVPGYGTNHRYLIHDRTGIFIFFIIRETLTLMQHPQGKVHRRTGHEGPG